MPKYKYNAQDYNGRRVNGLMFAIDEVELHMKLKEKELYLVSYTISENRHMSGMFHAIFKPAVLADFNRQLGQLIGSGISLVRAMNILIQEEAIKPHQRAVYEDILRLILQGQPISDALEVQKAFPPFMVGMYRAAEAGGNLEKTANKLAADYDREYRLSVKIRNATSYTKVLCIITFLVIVIMFAFILPKFEKMFASIELPAATRILFAVRDMFIFHWPVIFITAAVLFIVFRSMVRIPAVAYLLDKLKLELPIAGKLMKTVYTARFARTLSSLYSAGLPITSALQTAKNTIGNEYISRQFVSVIAEVRTGGSLSAAIEKVKGFNKKLSASIRIGEEAGALDSMLSSVCDVLEYEAETSMTKLVGYLEPVLIVVMAVIIGFIVISMITPFYQGYSEYYSLDPNAY
jgi:type IV pilus assembly protein PilC